MSRALQPVRALQWIPYVPVGPAGSVSRLVLYADLAYTDLAGERASILAKKRTPGGTVSPAVADWLRAAA